MALSKLASVSPMGMSVTGSPTCEGRARGGFGFFWGAKKAVALKHGTGMKH